MSEQHGDHLVVVYTTISLICQTLFYGVYVALLPFSTHLLLKKKVMTKANRLMFNMTIFMFLSSTAYWTASVGNLIATLNIFYASSPDHSSKWFLLYTLFNALILINYVLTDSVVVWRAWVLCRDGCKKMLWIPLFFLVCTSLSVLATIGIRAAMDAGAGDFNHILDISQITNLTLSLITNINATSIIAYRAWEHRQSIRLTLSKERTATTKVEKVLTLVIESGFIYCVSGILVLIASVIRLPFGTLGDIYTPIHVQIAGIYPTVVLVLVSQERSLKEGVFSTVGQASGIVTVPIESMNFRSNPAFAVSTILDNGDPSDDDEESASNDSRLEADVNHLKGAKELQRA